MTVRNGLLAMATGLAVAGTGAAQPPVGPGVEGREPNPIARDYHQSEPATFGYGGGPAAAARPSSALPGAGWWTVAVVWEIMLDRMTVPLGTVPTIPGDWD